MEVWALQRLPLFGLSSSWPTRSVAAVAVVVVVGFEEGRVSHEHNYWDQATVLVQAGLLDPSDLPVV